MRLPQFRPLLAAGALDIVQTAAVWGVKLQDLTPPVGVAVDLNIEEGAFILGDSPGLGIRIDEAAIAARPRRTQPRMFQGPNVRPERAGQRL